MCNPMQSATETEKSGRNLTDFIPRWTQLYEHSPQDDYFLVLCIFPTCWSWNSKTLATWCDDLIHLKRPWCWERLGTHTQIHTHLWPNEISTGKCQTPVYYFFYTWIYRTHRLDKMMSCFSPNNCLCSRVFDIKSYIYKALFLRSSLEIYVSIFNSGSHHSELWVNILK